MNWISVNERLPEPGERVIFTTDSFVGEGYANSNGDWFRYGYNFPISVKTLGKVTHWQQLPESPNKNG